VNNWSTKSLSLAWLPCHFRGRAAAADGANKDEAIAMVKKAVTFIKGQGAEKAYAEFTGKAANFIDRDLYVAVISRRQGAGPRRQREVVGKEMLEAQDVDGKFYVKERVDLANKNASFWQDYKFVNPVSKKVEPKQMYCEKVDNTAVCAGIYNGTRNERCRRSSHRRIDMPAGSEYRAVLGSSARAGVPDPGLIGVGAYALQALRSNQTVDALVSGRCGNRAGQRTHHHDLDGACCCRLAATAAIESDTKKVAAIAKEASSAAARISEA
jgi:hypothetical protein